MEKLLFEAVSPSINSSKFGLDSAQKVFQFELTCNEIYTRADIIRDLKQTEVNLIEKHRYGNQTLFPPFRIGKFLFSRIKTLPGKTVRVMDISKSEMHRFWLFMM